MGVETSNCELCGGARMVQPSGAVVEQHQKWCHDLRRVSSTVLELQNTIDRLDRIVEAFATEVEKQHAVIVKLEERIEKIEKRPMPRGEPRFA